MNASEKTARLHALIELLKFLKTSNTRFEKDAELLEATVLELIKLMI